MLSSSATKPTRSVQQPKLLDTETSETTRTFHRFPDLPLELRWDIWDLALARERFLQVKLECDRMRQFVNLATDIWFHDPWKRGLRNLGFDRWERFDDLLRQGYTKRLRRTISRITSVMILNHGYAQPSAVNRNTPMWLFRPSLPVMLATKCLSREQDPVPIKSTLKRIDSYWLESLRTINRWKSLVDAVKVETPCTYKFGHTTRGWSHIENKNSKDALNHIERVDADVMANYSKVRAWTEQHPWNAPRTAEGFWVFPLQCLELILPTMRHSIFTVQVEVSLFSLELCVFDL
ncbi:hypothetical protein F53441_11609 [Fusarium austroafricanum]|uniref:2EXR domain-containing protein n=1 Tax=Fusarium austroafricanum TaxID=2364996 RepID=A0A8H4NPL4_9HYPO|nr:hypothetical protein F53441_11609 [Fusarium austroafricanum]